MIPAVVIIDMLNGMLVGQPSQRLIPSENLPGLTAKIQALVDEARKMQIPVIHVCCEHEENDLIFQTIPPHALRGTWEAKIIADLTPESADTIVKKRFYDGFFETELDTVLRRFSIEKLYLAGIQTDCCVHSTGQGAIFRGYRATLVSDCCDTISKDRQVLGLERFKDLVGPVQSLSEVKFNS